MKREDVLNLTGFSIYDRRKNKWIWVTITVPPLNSLADSWPCAVRIRVMDGEITERSPDLLGKSSGKRKESLVKKKKKKNTTESIWKVGWRQRGEKGKRSFRENMWGGWNARGTWLGRQGVCIWSESGPFSKILECVLSGIKTYQFFIPFKIKNVFAMNVTLGWCSSERGPVWKRNREQPALCGLHTFNVRSASNDSLAYRLHHPCPPQHPFSRKKKNHCKDDSK